MWYTLLIVLLIIVSFLLILIVLVQNPKGGGLSAGFTGMNQFGGVAQTNKFLEQTTWTLAIAIVVFSIAATATLSKKQVQKSQMLEIVKDINFDKAPNAPMINGQQNPNTNQTNTNNQ